MVIRAKDKDKGKTSKQEPDMTNWTLEQIAEFWDTHDSADYWDESKEVKVEVAQRPTRAVSVRLTEEDIEELKEIANSRGIGHTTLIRMWIKEKLRTALSRERWE